ncbi:MAG: toxin-antitoxin system HicB family antitoxin [Ardenticatenaceae bacterium]|nr:toxin-antitoxin system HicB family antitoxin [Ardenticatenaceae bacterium]
MNNTQVITLRIPSDLKSRVARLAAEQGVSINQLVTYALTEKVTALEAERFLASSWSGKTEAEIFAEFDAVMARVPKRKEEAIPEWDRLA